MSVAAASLTSIDRRPHISVAMRTATAVPRYTAGTAHDQPNHREASARARPKPATYGAKRATSDTDARDRRRRSIEAIFARSAGSGAARSAGSGEPVGTGGVTRMLKLFTISENPPFTHPRKAHPSDRGCYLLQYRSAARELQVLGLFLTVANRHPQRGREQILQKLPIGEIARFQTRHRCHVILAG